MNKTKINMQKMMEKEEVEAESLLRYLRGGTSEKENIVIEEWINQNPENEKLSMQVGQIYYAQYTSERMKGYNPYWAFEKNRARRRRKKIKRALKYAVGIAATIAITMIVTITLISNEVKYQAETQYITISTNPGMQTNFNLPDGTLVYLNSASKLIYPIPYDAKERRVCLEGEAYFEVKTNKEYPFIVSVAEDKMRVKVTGTSFNLTAYPGEEVHTTLVKGAVDIQVVDNQGNSSKHVLNDTTQNVIYNYNTDNLIVAQRTILPAEKATFNSSTRKVSIKQVIPEYEYAWKDGKLIFKDTPIPEVLQRLSYYYNVKFDVKDPIIESYRFTGTFQYKQLSQVLDYLQHTNKIKYTIKTTTQDDSNGMKHTIILLEKKD